MITEPKSICINLPIKINESVENAIKFIVSRNKSLTEYTIKNEIKELLFKYRHEHIKKTLLFIRKLNPIQDGGGQKDPPTSFSPVTSTNVGVGPQNFLTFSFNSFATLLQNFKFVPSASPKLLNLNHDHSSKKATFLVKSL